MESQRIPLDKIIVPPDRLRGVNPDQALLIASSFAARGQDTPIQVRTANKAGKHVLIIGGHRIEAARIAGWPDIEAFVRDVSADEARQIEIDENVYRAELSDLDRAVFLAEKKRLYEKANPAAKHGGDRRSDQVAIFGNLVPRFTEEVCDRLGLSERSVSRILKRATLSAEIRSRIANTPLARNGSELDALVKLEPEQQAAVVERLLAADAPARNVGEAVRAIAGVRPAVKAGADLEFEAFLRAWKAAGAAARGRILAYLAETGALTREAAE
ncbi:MAG: ParB N-terminal domain-containing protein [Rhizobiales bacterium]|nr:ParB N-terminal domain-containing protein [Hyphomicrobiales bacterium]